ncbi:homoserine kinase [Larsenimonas rhizosphaerae]|uniref:Homoserine kinase n=1 Tax=Larsenimonas rhizosphaerae TaxID=2944682 RepID=A0AA41ZGB1_9GAMM|nr:homoserine kinase [Larsenimonas rhizosphaerae]MCM2129574.1 homoserine kinase [Larsenimonas rhizosphaerae]MCX2524232.1 homoserine kinase [Larsenimonas rhizosphaerae]
MAVFTPLQYDQVSDFLTRYSVGELTRLDEVASGTENSTFFVTTDRQAMVLTLFEQGDQQELPFFVELLDFLAVRELPIPGPIHDREGIALQRLADRPALLFPRLPGRHPDTATLAQCRAIGDTLGRMHDASRHFKGKRPNPRDLRWISATYPRVMGYLNAEDQALMRDEIDAYRSTLSLDAGLPQGALHGDLFRDNTLFEGDRLGGLIDFYNGCTGDLIFDLAIVINDWCSNDDGSLDEQRYDAIMKAYQEARPFEAAEHTHWPMMLRMTALRYWLSRLLVVYVDAPAHALTPKDPAQYRAILKSRSRMTPPPLV